MKPKYQQDTDYINNWWKPKASNDIQNYWNKTESNQESLFILI